MTQPHPEWTTRLLGWYDTVKRDFPWRQDTDPYRVWVSEIMLQQTRIEAAMGYYRRFMQALPTVADLAAVEDDVLLKLWEGLGYYSRARNLKKAAVMVMQQFGGQIPASYPDLLSLPGIGEYTAGAIASISFGIPVPAVDGNVLRVLARLTADREDVLKPAAKKRLSALAAQMVPADRPGAYNQAIMELGETVCLPNTVPDCSRCPLNDLCEANRLGCAAELPVRAPKKEKRLERRTVLVIISEQHDERRVLLRRRPSSGLLAHLWELPAAEEWVSAEQACVAAKELLDAPITLAQPLPEARHMFSHIEWKMRGFCLTTATDHLPPDYVWADAEELTDVYALPSAFRTYARLLPKLLSKEETI